MTLALVNGLVRGYQEAVDIVIEGPRIVGVGPELGDDADEKVDVSGHMVLPAFVDPHIHLDKCLLGEVMPPNNSGTLEEAIEITNEFKRNYQPSEIADRATRVIEAAVRNGTIHMRVFVDVGTIGGLRPLEGLLLAKERVKKLANLQLVAFPQEGLIRDPGAERLLEEALNAGADVVGGLPWYEFTDVDMQEHIDICLDLARRFQRPVHMLVDDTDNPNSRSLEYLAVQTMRSGLSLPVAVSHCGALAAYDDAHAAKVIDMVKQARIDVVSNAHISLMLAGRGDREPIRRGITRVREFLSAGVNVASGQDDVHDPYYPFGRPDQLEVALFMAHTAHLSLPHELETVMDMVTGNAARVLGIQDYGINVGNTANIVVLEGDSTVELLRNRPPRRYVFRDGDLIAESSLESVLKV